MNNDNMTLRVALLQIIPGADTAENLAIGERACREAKRMGAHLAVFPEMFSSGYNIPENPDVLRELAVPADGEFVSFFGRLAAELDMAIAVTFLEKHDPLPRNSVCLFDRRGNALFTYAKVHTCDFGDERLLTHGDEFFVAPLETQAGTVNVGAMICYDREFPESARILMLKGAELIIVPNACPMEINRISQLRGRAYENMLGIVTVNYPLGKPDCNGHSTAFDGMAYLPEPGGSRDTMLLDAGEKAGVYTVDMPIGAIRRYRNSEVHGDAYRRPEIYGLLTEDMKRSPFLRADFRK